MYLPRKYETDNTGWIETGTLPYLMKIMAIIAVAGVGNLLNSFLSDKLTPGLFSFRNTNKMKSVAVINS